MKQPARGAAGCADWACAAVLVLLPALFLAPSLFGGRVLLPADLMLLSSPWRDAGRVAYPEFRYAHNGMFDPLCQHYPWKTYYSRSFRAGRIPLWNPYEFGGQPFAATGQPAVFYPPNLLFALIDPARAFGFVAFFHLALAGLSLFALAREMGCRPAASLAGAIAFQFTGLFVVTLEFTSYLATMAWLPLIVLALRRVALGGHVGWVAAAGGAIGLQLLAGHMQYAVYSLAAAMACTVHFTVAARQGRDEMARRACRMVVAVALGSGVAALHLLPCLELGLLSSRKGAGSYSAALTQAMPARQLLALLIPDPFGNPVDCGDIYRYVENYPYLGIGPLFLLPAALLGRRRREGWLFAGLFAGGLLLAFGTHLNWLFFKLVPGFAQLTGLGRAIYLSAFGGAMGAALGAETLLERLREDRAWPWRYAKGAMVGAFAATAVLVGFALLTLESPRLPEALGPFYQKVMRLQLAPPDVLAAARTNVGVLQPFAVDAFLAHLGRRVAAFLGLVTVLLAGTVTCGQAGIRARAAPWLFAGAMAVDLFLYGVRFNPQLPRGMLDLDSPAVAFLGRAERPVRIASLSADGNPLHRLPPNLPMVHDLQDVNGSDSLSTKAYVALLTRIADPRSPGFPQPDPGSPVLDLLGVRYLATEGDLDGIRGFRQVVGGRFRVYENGQAYPRVWVAPRTAAVADEATALETIIRGAVNLRRVAVVATPSTTGEAASGGDVRLVWYEPHRVSAEGAFPSGSWVVLADAYYPGWRAWADGRPAQAQRVDYILRGVRADREASRLDMVYAPASFAVGEFASCLAIGVLAGMCVVAVRRRGMR